MTTTTKTVEPDENPRLRILDSTLKNLFALTGNRCAFTGCQHSIINDTGQVVAQVAHIHGVKPKAARFDASVSAERLRDASNLLVLCGEHHITTDDVSVYTVEVMRDMKAAHENRFGGLISGLRSEISDLTKGTVVRMPVTLSAYARLFGLSESADSASLDGARKDFIAFGELLAQLTPDIRTVYSTIIDRGTEDGENVFEITVAELEEALNLDERRLGNLLGILTRHNLVNVGADEDREGYYAGVVWATTNMRPGGTLTAPILSEVKYMASELGVSVGTLIVDLDWRSLDNSIESEV
ncbi:hypothetical protein JXX30_00410 [Rhodococcus erythropolis]|uniref:hypothetical protein n=1 Tax=Rhodococcus erythropolis TaxID=1833 RepID=UPI001980D999|nr:hypothetical protein [Rhodococcus erythropolis]QSE41337.1 hypothetical protein JXX30_00410 [Rhodococcus erythropolis]